MSGEGVIRYFFIFGSFLPDPVWDRVFLIEFGEFEIGDCDTSIGSLILIYFPDMTVGMRILMTELAYFDVSYHDVECDTIGNLPLVFFTDIWFISLRFLLYLEGKKCLLFPSLKVLSDSYSKFIAISFVDRCLDDENLRKTLFDPLPLGMSIVDDELSFDFFCHNN
jgi:hypothetical protein